MTGGPDRALDWMEEGTRLFLARVGELDDADFASPTALPGWTRAHLIAHVHFNALALRRLARWAATGEPHPMYGSPEQRSNEIATGSRLPPTTLRQSVRWSAADLANDVESLTDEAWRNEVVTAQGRTIPAAEIPWLRAREVAIHAVDLGVGVGFDDLPGGFVDALLLDVVRRRAHLGEGPRLAGWLTGRESSAPVLGPWL